MNRRRVILTLLMGLISGLVATVGAYSYISKKPAPPQPVIKLEPVVIARNNVARGERLQRRELEVVSWPASLVPPAAIQKLGDAENRVTFVNLLKGEPILEGRLAPVGASPGLGGVVSPGMRAVTVRVDDVIGVAGFLVPGSRVDVLTTMDVPGRRSASSTVSKMILQDIKVLAVGQQMTEPNQKSNGKPSRTRITVVTLLVSPAQAERLTLASTRGRILLSLRNTADREPIRTPGVTPPQLIYGAVPMASDKKPEPKIQAVPQPRMRDEDTIEIIRGEKRSRESLDRRND